MDKLEQLLNTMDIPPMRKNDNRWLMRNLAIRNGEHPDFDEVIALLRKQHLDNTPTTN